MLSAAVPVDPDELEVLVGAATGDQMLRSGASSGAHGSSDLEPAVETAAVA